MDKLNIMRKEIEVKARVGDMEAITRKLVEFDCKIGEPVEQRDTIFVASDYGAFEEFHPGKNLLRIRESKGKYLFTIKQPQVNELDAIEHETEILDPKEMREAILLMGLEERCRVNKVRRKANYNGWEICLDEVEGLGSFIEVEKIAEDEDAEVIQEELFKFLETLGVKRSDRVTSGYDTLVYLKNNPR